jgi:hypothetical protein
MLSCSRIAELGVVMAWSCWCFGAVVGARVRGARRLSQNMHPIRLADEGDTGATTGKTWVCAL